MIASSTSVLNVARSQLGQKESPPFSNRTPYTGWYGLVGPWCAMFVSWVFAHAGYPIAGGTTARGFAYCPSIVAWAKQQGTWRDKTYVPNAGDIILFDFIGRPSHVGIVVGVLPDGRVHTIEGNTNGAGSRDGGSVMEHYRSVSGGIIGYVVVDEITPTAPAPVPPAPPRPGRPILRVGAKGKDVLYLQEVMREKAGQHISNDGDFGPATLTAVKNVQKFFGLTPDGVVGAKTWTVIDMLSAR